MHPPSTSITHHTSILIDEDNEVFQSSCNSTCGPFQSSPGVHPSREVGHRYLNTYNAQVEIVIEQRHTKHGRKGIAQSTVARSLALHRTRSGPYGRKQRHCVLRESKAVSRMQLFFLLCSSCPCLLVLTIPGTCK